MKLDDKTRTEPVDVEPEGAEVVTCPATGEVVGSVPMTQRAEVEAVDRLGRSVVCDIRCTPFSGGTTGIVVIMEPVRQT